MITCKKCQTEKDDDDFRSKRRVCKDCERAHGREYRRVNKDKSKKWTEENKERMKELQSNWYKANKQKINEKFKQRYRDTSSDFKKIKNYRTAVCYMLGGMQKTNKYIGCGREPLVKWCESSFEEGMTMKNYGKYWVVDHVIPLDTLKENPDLFEMLTKWYNIMPVTNSYNLTKNNRIYPEQVEKHLNRLIEYKNKKIDQKYLEYLQKTLLREVPKAINTTSIPKG